MAWETCPSCDKSLSGKTECECGWSVPMVPKPQETYQQLPHGITKEQFGLHLFETIKTVSMIEQLRKNRSEKESFYRAKPGALKQWQLKEQELLKLLPAMLIQLQPEDVVEMMKRHPWTKNIISGSGGM